jgi:hypothetical protein
MNTKNNIEVKLTIKSAIKILKIRAIGKNDIKKLFILI